MTKWHQLEPTAVENSLQTTLGKGLSDEECARRTDEFGPNELQEFGGRSPWRIIWEQISGAMVILLIVAAVVSVALQDYTDAVVIMAIVVINAALGFFQDYRAERALAALKKMAVPVVRVRRGGDVREISASMLVPGDVVLLEVGNQIPADCRLLQASNLKVQEAALTGESEPVEKSSEILKGDDLPLGDRRNMGFMGTLVTYGRGAGIVTETGMRTELGQIAHSLQSLEAEPTPLQRRLAQLGRSLAAVALVIVAIVFCLGVLQGESYRLMLMTSLSLAVAVVPEGLPAVATVALALGARRMFHRHALIRKLPAVETLGSVTVICSDKTGTLTENRMTVTILDVAGDHVDLPASGTKNDTSTVQSIEGIKSKVQESSVFNLLLVGVAICNDAELVHEENNGETPEALGDPTEVALMLAAARCGYSPADLHKLLPRKAEIPFDSDRKRMTTIHEIDRNADVGGRFGRLIVELTAANAERVAWTKGAVDSLLQVSGFVFTADGIVKIDDEWKERIATADEELASRGMRVLGVAFRPLNEIPEHPTAETVETELILLGLLGMIDPPRPEAGDAVARCRTAGIRPVMITGDHQLTASQIAKELGISTEGKTLTGRELEKLTPEELRDAVKDVSVYARVAPKHKLQLVRALQESGEIVAMTGDGVNDAPALKQSHIGVAMGITGTDVSKESSLMVLMDDNFATIVNAVEEGRMVYDNIRKFVRYTMTSNAGEIWVMVLGPILGMPLPLLPLQILWVNLVTDGLPGLALAVEKPERGTMERPPHPPSAQILDREMGWDIAWIGLLMGAVSISWGYWYWLGDPVQDKHWRTIVFTVLTFSQMGNAMAIRSKRDSLFQLGVFSNRFLVGAVSLTMFLQLLVIYWKPLQTVFQTGPLTLAELAGCIALSAVVFWCVEAQKLIMRNREAKKPPKAG